MDILTSLWYDLFTMPVDDLLFLHARHMPFCDARVDKHFDGYHTLQFAVNGGVELFYEDRHYVLPAGQAWFWTAYPGPHIRFHAVPGGNGFWNHRYAAFQGNRVAHWIVEGIWPEGPCSAPVRIHDYAERFDHLLYLTQQSDRWSRARAINLLEAFLIEIAEDRTRQATPAPPTEPWLASLLSLLNDNASSPVPEDTTDYAEFARQWSVSLSTLRRRFRAATGVPLHEYAIQGRIARARSLLGETDLPVKAVAEKLGYRDVYFFTRQFRQEVGVPPAAYRRSRQG